MLKKTALSLAALLLAGTAHANPAFEGEDHSYATLLLSPAEADTKLAAKALARHRSTNPALFDVAAELLWGSCQNQRHFDEDTQAWLVVALGKSQQMRYEPVLSYCFKHAVPKVQQRARSALGDLKFAGEAYVPGSANLAAIPAQLAESVKRDAAHRPAPATFYTLNYGQSLQDVYKVMGLPDHVQLSSLESKDHVISNYVIGILASYDNAGTVIFNLPNGEESHWIVGSLTNAKPVTGADPHLAQVRQWLGSSDTYVLEALAKDLITHNEKDRTALDAVAGRIGQWRSVDDAEMADSIAWLCKSLGRSQDGRYKTFLKEIARTAASNRLRKHCGDAANELADDPQPFRLDAYVASQSAAPAPKLPEVPVNVPGVNEPVQVVPVAGASTTTTATAAPNTTTAPAAAAPAPSAQPAQPAPSAPSQ